MPTRFGMAPEAASLDLPIRHLLYGVANKLTHRVLYTIEDNDVIIYRVLHFNQNVLDDEDDL